MVGLQFRVGFTSPYYTITAINSPTSLTIDQTWGGNTQSTVGYTILQNIVSLGANVKRVLEMVNQFFGYRLYLNIPQEALNKYDTWRSTVGWTYMLANTVPSPTGSAQWELYPAPTTQQTFPFLAYVQAADLVDDTSTPVAFVRSDVLVLGTLPNALTFRGSRKNPYYDPQLAAAKMREFEVEIEQMALNDENLYGKDLQWDYSLWPMSNFGATWRQSHDDTWLGSAGGGSW
jgi:hypothetical protein